jgi:hypothetical protein
MTRWNNTILEVRQKTDEKKKQWENLLQQSDTNPLMFLLLQSLPPENWLKTSPFFPTKQGDLKTARIGL